VLLPRPSLISPHRTPSLIWLYPHLLSCLSYPTRSSHLRLHPVAQDEAHLQSMTPCCPYRSCSLGLTFFLSGSEATEVCHRSWSFRDRTFRVCLVVIPPVSTSAGLTLLLGWPGQGEDCQGERMGCLSAEAHIFWLVGGRHSALPCRTKHLGAIWRSSGWLWFHRAGKILQDDKTIESYNIEEKGFIVCMVSKVWDISRSILRASSNWSCSW